MTDCEAPRYSKLGNDFSKHNAVDHSRGEYGYRDRESGEENQHQHRRGLLQHLQA